VSALYGLLTYIPGVLSLLTALQKSWFDAKVAIYQARTGAAKDVAIAAITAEVTNNQTKVNWIVALASNPVMMFIVFGFAMPFIIYEWQAIVYDKVWMHGATKTDYIDGPLAEWAHIILTGIFVTSTGIGVAHAFISKKD